MRVRLGCSYIKLSDTVYQSLVLQFSFYARSLFLVKDAQQSLVSGIVIQIKNLLVFCSFQGLSYLFLKSCIDRGLHPISASKIKYANFVPRYY